jgi:hypothetical protein
MVHVCGNQNARWVVSGQISGHAGVAAKASQRDKVRSRSDREGALRYKLERLCHYVTRPTIAEKRLSLTNWGKVSYELNTRMVMARPITHKSNAYCPPIDNLFICRAIQQPALYLIKSPSESDDIKHDGNQRKESCQEK